MLRGRILTASSTQCKRFISTRGPRPVPNLPDASLETFTNNAFNPATPAKLPPGTFASIPAIQKWFLKPSKDRPTTLLNTTYLAKFGATIVPLEISNAASFARIEQSLSFFLDSTSLTTPTARVYLAQAPLADLPRALAQDVPTPEFVLRAGKGDVYDSSIWLGQAPTYTPLHRDPNPNLFVQLAGRKRVRLMRPEVGLGVFARVQERIGGGASATMRGEEMMVGREKEALEEEAWGEGKDNGEVECWDAELESGDGLFIPKGWWHSVKGTGEGMTGSVNWWFR